MNFRNATQTALVEARIRADRRRQRIFAIVCCALMTVGLAAMAYVAIYTGVQLLEHWGAL